MDNPLVQPDPGLFFWTIAVFLVLLFLLKKFAWGPLLAALDERQAGIRKSLDDADTAKRELAEVQARANALIGKARMEADAILSEARADGAKIREELRDLAQQQAQAITRNAQQQIQLERDRTISELRREAVDLSVMIASKLIRRNLTREDNAALIDEALQQVDSTRIQ
jgi:F-type H+-transporting ATPase subunit b